MSNSAVPLIFGEVLFDVFNDRNAVPGGAPFNVAWHLQGFGLNPLFISRIGQDENGEKIRNLMHYWNMNPDGLQLDSQYPTGVVSVQTHHGDHSFTIMKNQAYDFIESSHAVSLAHANPVNLFYHGTLALRNRTSRKACADLLQEIDGPVFLDVNLRSPWWTHKNLGGFLKTTDWIKCNREELDLLSKQTTKEKVNLSGQSKSLVQHFNVKSIIVTLGAEGAFIMDNTGESFQSAPPRFAKVIDTVGAGDAFSAVSIMGILKKWKSSTVLERAQEFASKICKVQGATLNDMSYYRHLLKKWDK